MSIYHVALLIFAIIGLAKLTYSIIKTCIRESYTSEYLKRFNDWLKNPQGNIDDQEYTWLTQNLGRIQTELGVTGVAARYIPPGRNVVLSNYQIIVNILPLIRIRRTNELEVISCKDALNRHIGNLKYRRRKQFFSFANPFQWIFQGIKVIITFPLYLWYWIGLSEYNKISEVKESKVIKIIGFVITLVSLIGTFIGIIVDWDDFIHYLVK